MAVLLQVAVLALVLVLRPVVQPLQARLLRPVSLAASLQQPACRLALQRLLPALLLLLLLVQPLRLLRAATTTPPRATAAAITKLLRFGTKARACAGFFMFKSGLTPPAATYDA
ncbi:hypothetical protein [Uliginosibacterium sediminicola]|uniref:Secreted protein n=1 Tax=Uliginosibacterium sediminicola TaxID=2024550 RepID=A0ABU9Z3E6_9RHOO